MIIIWLDDSKHLMYYELLTFSVPSFLIAWIELFPTISMTRNRHKMIVQQFNNEL